MAFKQSQAMLDMLAMAEREGRILADSDRNSPPKPLKYRNEPCEINGIKFASKKEAARFILLSSWFQQNKINTLRPHPEFLLEVNGHKICHYIADFSYYEDGQLVVEDVKSKATKTPVYRLKKKLMLALYGIEIKEV